MNPKSSNFIIYPQRSDSTDLLGKGWQTPKTNCGLPPVFIREVYWNTATLIYLCIIYACFHALTAELKVAVTETV